MHKHPHSEDPVTRDREKAREEYENFARATLASEKRTQAFCAKARRVFRPTYH